MVEWMRAWNADPRHRKKVRFAGFDMQITALAARNLVAFLDRVEPGAGDLSALLAPFADGRFDDGDAGARAAADRALAPVVARFGERRAAWRRAVGAQAFDVARQDLQVIEQAVEVRRAGNRSTSVRDRLMADNVAWILAHQPRGTRMVVWAHDSHVSRIQGAMGSYLRAHFGAAYLSVGSLFGEGSFQAFDLSPGSEGGVGEITVGPAPDTDVATAFARTGQPILVADLRAAPRGVVASWLATPHASRAAGSIFVSEEALIRRFAPSQAYDALIFAARTTRARPLHAAD